MLYELFLNRSLNLTFSINKAADWNLLEMNILHIIAPTPVINNKFIRLKQQEKQGTYI